MGSQWWHQGKVRQCCSIWSWIDSKMITTLTFCMMLHVKQKNYNNNIYNIYNYNNRELKRFLSSFITTDCFHEASHTSCSKSFRTQACMKLMNINCEACEQTNCALRKITISTTFMSPSMYLRSLIQPQNEINVPPTKGLKQVSAYREKYTFF